MIQSSLFWLALGIALPIHWRLPARWRPGFFALVSMAVLATLAPLEVLALAGWCLACHRLLATERRARLFALPLGIGMIAQLLTLKYLPRLIEPLWPESAFTQIAVPLGLSFFTFKLLHYVVEMRRGGLEPHGIGAVLSWIFALPMFTAGPIERFDHYQRHREVAFSWSSLAEGGTRIVHGLIKKFLVADLLLTHLLEGRGWSIDATIGGLESVSAVGVWYWAVLSFLRLYMDFGGYSDIAIGGCLLFGYRVGENYDWPLISPNVSNFWKRWHISLAAWCQSYIYMPIIGLTRNPFVALYATFVVMGLWHAASLPWIVWGLAHGTAMSVGLLWRRTLRRRRWRWNQRRWFRAVAIVTTMLFIAGTYSLTRVHGHGDAGDLVRLAAKLLFVDLPH